MTKGATSSWPEESQEILMHITRRSLRVAALLATAFAPTLMAQPSPLIVTKTAVASADVALTIGEISDVAFDGRHLVVASEREGRLVVLTPSLRILSRVGRRGSGPGEYRELRAVRVAGGKVFALDRALRRLYQYQWLGDSLRLEAAIKLPLDPYDFIPSGGGEYWVLGPHGGSRLHRVSADGRILQSLWPLPSGAPAVAEQLAQDGWMERVPGGFLIVSPYSAATTYVSDVPLGEIQVDSLSGFQPTTVEGFRDGVTVRSGPAGASTPTRPVVLPQAMVLVQAAVVARQDGGDDRPQSWLRAKSSRRWQGPMRTDSRLFPMQSNTMLAQYQDDEGTIALVKVDLPGSSPRGKN
jgi:hypothetical protein